MTDEKSSKSKKTDNFFGFYIGCFIIVVAVAVVIFFLFIKPALEDAGYSYSDLKEKVFEFKAKAGDALERTDKIYQDGKEKYKEIKTDEPLDDFQNLDVQSQEELEKASPKLIAD